jgi:AraC-like DNA-binding protein
VPFPLDQLTRPHVTVGDVAASVQLSRRRLIEVFTSEVGMTPKRLSRAVRFQRACALARAGAPDWARLALACGYFDQAHLINDVRELTGTSPTQLVRASEQVKDLHLATSARSSTSARHPTPGRRAAVHIEAHVSDQDRIHRCSDSPRSPTSSP